MNTPATIDEHINSFPPAVQHKLNTIRNTIHSLVPEATETIKYGIPTFVYKGKNMVHFAGYKAHIGFYPTPHALEAFSEKLKPYLAGKGTAQFPLDAEVPIKLVEAITLYRKESIDKETPHQQ